MPYVLKEKKREYQNKWVKRKRGDKPKVITYAQLTQEKKIKCYKTYKTCVSEAKSLVGKNPDKLAIVAIAQRACIIRHGRDTRSEHAKGVGLDDTLKNFAIDF